MKGGTILNREDMADKLDIILRNHEFFDYPDLSEEKKKKHLHNIKKMKKYLLRNELDKVFEDVDDYDD